MLLEDFVIGAKTTSNNLIVDIKIDDETILVILECLGCKTQFSRSKFGVIFDKCLCPICFTSSGFKKNRFVGRKIGRWTVKSCLNRLNKSNYMLYDCICDCGTRREVASNSLDGRSKSCGCLAAELTKARYANFPKKTRKTRNISSAVWRRLTKYIKTRDSNKCLLCSGAEKLTPHHLEGWNWCNAKRYDEENLVLLCDFCHNDFHSKYCKGNNTKGQFLEYIQNYPINIDSLFEKMCCYKNQNGFIKTLTDEQLKLMQISINAE